MITFGQYGGIKVAHVRVEAFISASHSSSLPTGEYTACDILVFHGQYLWNEFCEKLTNNTYQVKDDIVIESTNLFWLRKATAIFKKA